jgi:hypothetical protein
MMSAGAIGMSETQHHVDVDLTVIPAQRHAPEDLLEIVHRPEPQRLRPAQAATAQPPDNLAAFFSMVVGVVVVLSVLLSFGLVDRTNARPAPLPPGRGDITGLLLNPSSGQPAASTPAPASTEDLLTRLLTP